VREGKGKEKEGREGEEERKGGKGVEPRSQ